MKKKSYILVIAIIIIGISFCLSFVQAETIPEYEKVYTEEELVPLYQLLDGAEIAYEVKLKSGHYSGMILKVGTYGEKVEGDLNIEVKSMNKNAVVANSSIDTSNFSDGSLQQIDFEKGFAASTDDRYQIVITSNGLNENNTLTFFAYEGATNSKLLMNGEELKDKDLMIVFCQRVFDQKRFMYLIFSLIVLELYVAYVVKVVTEEV